MFLAWRQSFHDNFLFSIPENKQKNILRLIFLSSYFLYLLFLRKLGKQFYYYLNLKMPNKRNYFRFNFYLPLRINEPSTNWSVIYAHSLPKLIPFEEFLFLLSLNVTLHFNIKQSMSTIIIWYLSTYNSY